MRTLQKPKPRGVNFAREERQGLLPRIFGSAGRERGKGRAGRGVAVAMTVLLTMLASGAATVRAGEPLPRVMAPVGPTLVSFQRGYALRAEDAAMLDEVQRRAVLFFNEQTDAVTGLTRDRAPNNGAFSRAPSSVAATGFALTAWCIGEERGWLRTGEARRRVVQTLRFVAEAHAQEHGWLYHFVDATNGRRVWQSEASTIDTALFLQGALLAREYLRDAEVTELVNKIYARIDWRWALNGGATLSHGWKPESGFLASRWDSYAELMGLYLLGIGAKEGALPVETWGAWRREPWVSAEGPEKRAFIQCGPLFTHQYAHAWFDFRGRSDAQVDYWQNSVDATLAQREWSAAQRGRFPFWSKELWGLTASDSARGYVAWGTPMGREDDASDGTLVPCAPGGSLPFAPDECLTALRTMREVGGDGVWGRYGFSDAFNPQTGWVATDVIGINVGITLVMAENLRSGLVWQAFMRAPEVRRGMKLAGFEEPARFESGRVVTNP